MTDRDALALARHARVQAAMARRGVGAVLLATPHLAAFASGARRVQVAGSGGALPSVVIVAGAPSAVVFTADPDGAPSWMPRAAVEPLVWDRERALCRLAGLVGPAPGTVACDVFSPALREAIGRPLVDARPLLAEAAAPRTADEIAAVQSALRAARSALRAACRAAASVPALVAGFAAGMRRAGAGFPLGEGLVWRTGPRFVRLPATAALAAGEVVALELGLYLGGHAGVAGDTVVVGGGNLAAPRRAWFAALCAVAKRCRPGATAADLRAAAISAGARQEGLLAHGLGVGIEPPFVDLAGEDAEPLRPGTVLVLAPVVDRFRATRALIVTAGSPRWLEGAP